MQTDSRSLLGLVAADLMTERLVLVPEAMSLHGAARLLSQSNVSGAPVVDADGRCVGVLSAGDFLSQAAKPDQSIGKPPALYACVHSAWQLMEEETLSSDTVHCRMTADPVTAAPSTPIDEVARMMVDAHIHRVIVVDAEKRPVGVVSSTDILAAVAYARHGSQTCV